jgi:hypothetical protein
MSKIHESSVSHKRECGLCTLPIGKSERVNWHHPKPRSEGGTSTVAVHQECHVEHHSTTGADGLSDFQRWGKLSAIDCHWAFYLKGVKDNPLYDQARSFYQMYYSH